MREHLFLCGLTDTQCKGYANAQRLYLQGAHKNVNLQVDNLRDRLNKIEPGLLTDLLEIAVYVLRADNSIRRESRSDSRAGAEWRRTFRMVIAVREPGLWSEPSVQRALVQTLHFLSDDAWHFEFVDNLNPLPLQHFLPGLRTETPDRKNGTSVILFSGGLDSFAGAVYELQTSKRHVVLASHRTTPFIGKRQRELANVLMKEFPDRVTHVRVDAGATGPPSTREHSQRTRSFLFLAVGSVAAKIEESDRIRFYENGIMSANLPISEQVLGTHASRSTHPRSIMLFNDFISSAIDCDVAVDNPFSFDTKIEVVQRLKSSPFGIYIKKTLSCSSTRKYAIMRPHCGECKQCIERRIATLGADAADLDPSEVYRVELFTGSRQPGKHRALALDSVRTALEMATISLPDFARRFAGELGWLVSAYPQKRELTVNKFHSMCQRHGRRVYELFQAAVAQNSDALVSRTLPTDSLLWLAIDPFRAATGNVDLVPRSTLAAEADSDLAGNGAALAAHVTDEIVLLTDASLAKFQVEGLLPFTGPVEHALLRFLVEEHRKDRNAEREPEAFRGFQAKKLADVLETSDEPVRKLVQRVRDEVQDGFRAQGLDLGRDAFIESATSGYRLNPRVRIVVK